MKVKASLLWVLSAAGWCLLLAGTMAQAAAANWEWKTFDTPEDVLKLLNGQPPSHQPAVTEARVIAVTNGSRPAFQVFYRPGLPGTPGNWGWKKSPTPDDALNFLNGKAPYLHSVANAEIAAFQTRASLEFFIFYAAASSNAPGRWGWKKSSDPDDVLNFLNGTGAYQHAVSTARVVGAGTVSPVFYVFYQREAVGGALANWGWKKLSTAHIDDAQHFVNGEAPSTDPVPDFEISEAVASGTPQIFTFYNHGTRLWIESPLAGERFVVNEPVNLQAVVTSHAPVNQSQLQWTSTVAGDLGSGPDVPLSGLPVGSQNIQASGLSLSQSVSVRVFTDLGALYQNEPSPAEVERISSAFKLTYLDGSQSDEHWSAYDPPTLNQSSLLPSKLVVLARLDVLRHQAFSQPLPFGNGITVYENFRKYVSNVHLRLDCNFAAGGRGTVRLNRLGSEWWNLMRPDCKTPSPNARLAPYVDPLYLLVHEGRHSEPNDPGHTDCNGQTNMDATLDNGSGHAWAALYAMWVYKYGLYDPPYIKLEAKSVAISLLKTRFCSTPTSTNPAVQAIVTELLQ